MRIWTEIGVRLKIHNHTKLVLLHRRYEFLYVTSPSLYFKNNIFIQIFILTKLYLLPLVFCFLNSWLVDRRREVIFYVINSMMKKKVNEYRGGKNRYAEYGNFFIKNECFSFEVYITTQGKVGHEVTKNSGKWPMFELLNEMLGITFLIDWHQRFSKNGEHYSFSIFIRWAQRDVGGDQWWREKMGF